MTMAAEINPRAANKAKAKFKYLEIKLDPGSFEETPLAEGAFGSVHGARFVTPAWWSGRRWGGGTVGGDRPCTLVVTWLLG